mmetsp:Transcript_4997/g.10523  ORF Transcript_4997/g.10523 Transcript_4997/m.10523 type:complete len:485 (+) Transcript_4997:163-1617(+)
MSDESLALARAACAHFTASPTEFHNVANCVALLGPDFVKLDESEVWESKLKPGGKYYYTRNTSTLVAFAVGGAYSELPASPGGLKIIGGHTDSPNLRIKPRSSRATGAGRITQLNVETYGGGLWHTWFDRDLSVAGRVILEEEGGTYRQVLVDLKKPICRIPSLCIHLQTGEERAAFKVNKEDHLQPIFQQAVSDTLEKPAQKKTKTGEAKTAWAEGHDPLLLSLIAAELDVSESQISDFELALYDTQPACLGGPSEEFLYSARLDNQATCFAAAEALRRYASSPSLASDTYVSLAVLFDHEEVGSASQCGAGSPIMSEAVKRITASLTGCSAALPALEAEQIALRKSFCLSVDMAHAVHPNYAHKHDKNHAPALNAGVVVKSNANQRYTTNAVTGFLVRELARRAGVPLQEFVVRNDCPCGSTIGPIISGNTGLRVVDLGMPQLSMHSCREMMGSKDVKAAVDLFGAFYEGFGDVDAKCVRCT